jgi:hypothetical protein
MITIEELKEQKRWTLWRLETGKDGKPTKPPCSPVGFKHDITNPANLRTFAELEPLASKFSGLGFALGELDSVPLWGVDIDGCCDALTGKFTPESREVVIGLDSYGEYSPRGAGCHVIGLGRLPIEPGNKREVLIRPFPGCKQIEIKGLGFYFTFTGRHLSKTPAGILDRQEQVLALYNRVSKIPKPGKDNGGLTITMPVSEEERFQKLMAGDMSHYNGDHSAADFALCILLAKMYGCNAIKIDTEFRKSGLYRDKWERDDYRETTITRAILAVAKETLIIFDTDEPMEEDAPAEWIIQALPKREEGWFPLGEVSLVGGPSGAGKTHSLLRIAESARQGLDTFGHRTTVVDRTTVSDYCILLHDRSSASMRRTCNAAKVSVDEVMARVVRLTRAQQKERPATVVEAAIQTRPGVKLWIVEGLDFWTPKISDMEAVGDVMDELQRVAKQNRVAIVGTLGSPKQKENDHYASGRDQFMGSVAFGRKAETCISIENTSDASVRKMNVMPRNTAKEEFFFTWTDAGLTLTNEPIEPDKKADENSALRRMEANVFKATRFGEELKYSQSFGPPATFYRWRKIAQLEGKVTLSCKKWYRSYSGVECGEVAPVSEAVCDR